MNKFINESKKKFTLDTVLIGILLAMGAISLFNIYLTKPLIGEAMVNSLLLKQGMWFVIGSISIYALLKIGVDRMFTLINVAYWILMPILVLLALVGKHVISIPFMEPINGTAAWIQIPFLGSFQASEFMKIVLVIKSANVIEKHNKEKLEYTFKSDFKLIFEMAKYTIPPLILIILQPDTGIPIIILVSLATMFFISGVRKEWFFIIVGLAAGLLFGIVFLYYNQPDLLVQILGGKSGESYKLIRFYGWLDYEKYPIDHGYQLYNSLLSIGTAGYTGHPWMNAIAHFPEPQTDFIFAVIAQNHGFIGASAVILLVFSLPIKLILITLKSNLNLERYMMMGIIGMIVFQDFQNIAMIMGILPITGITLPFLSYGGSSLVSYMIPIAVAIHMYSETQNSHSHSL